MSAKQNASTFVSTLCRCGRTSSINNNSQVARRQLECGHYICSDCWHYNQPLPTPACNTCIIYLQAQEIPRLSFYVTAYNDVVKRFKELEKIHSGKLHEVKLKTKLAASHAPGIVASSSPLSLAQQLPNISTVSSTSATKPATIDWQSESGKQVSAYLMKQRETLAMYQKECESLKKRVADLTTQLETKNRPTDEAVTAIEKAELMEAELEGLHTRLAKCEDDLEKAQADLGTANSQNQQLAKELADLKELLSNEPFWERPSSILRAFRTGAIMPSETWHLQESMWNRQAKDEAIKANARSPRGASVDLPGLGTPFGGPSMIYVPTAAELQQSAALLTSLQSDVSRLNKEKSAHEHFREINKLKSSLKSKEDDNQVLGELHLAANSRAESAEEKLLDIQNEMQELRELMEAQAREDKATQNTAKIASGLTKLAEYQSRIAQLESQLIEATRARDEALAQAEVWQENRNKWKRWGEVMALQAKQWEDEVSRAKIPPAKNASVLKPEEPPALSLEAPESGKSRKRPLDMPDTDVDVVHAPARPQADNNAPLTVDSGGEGAERKRARFAS
ncbi:ATG16 domain-containing protein [Rhizoctonia solani AG-1 IA]|uniref:ATG16 domain-containing protein n=1 Tax=Thanatephorus cucumeris (strain AG1-IA) TaxID=983506 RepID=L8WY92_THACA|nr:ATG16 domain-containing protein [Rhizoctonia solani AG-1 IA]